MKDILYIDDLKVSLHALEQAEARNITLLQLRQAALDGDFAYRGSNGAVVFRFNNIEIVINNSVIITCITTGEFSQNTKMRSVFPENFQLAA